MHVGAVDWSCPGGAAADAAETGAQEVTCSIAVETKEPTFTNTDPNTSQ